MASRQEKSPNAYRTISEVAEAMDVPQHVLRFWESKFSQIKPMKRGGGRRYYSPEDVEVIQAIRTLLHEDGYTIKGAQKLLREQGVKNIVQHYVQGVGRAEKKAAEQPEAALSGTAEEPLITVSLKEELGQLREDLKNIQKKLKGELPK
ncbi:MerR family transcriptional regulator [Luteithermobacter gelatinilyticus]|uniref:MerR family transcriptional regulator n=1 Tax=Luteithermobacter gelatinilyticus TaxID=2582913 RepID=UPI001105D8C0|nr:MerR family transcriptional regulator [Luteithermobacter gelatinilyticus]